MIMDPLLGCVTIQDGAEDGSRVASSEKTLQVFVCFVCFFVVLRVVDVMLLV